MIKEETEKLVEEIESRLGRGISREKKSYLFDGEVLLDVRIVDKKSGKFYLRARKRQEKRRYRVVYIFYSSDREVFELAKKLVEVRRCRFLR